MLKKIFLFLVIVFLSSCGYEAIYSKKKIVNYDFSIIELSFIGDRDVNLKMKEKLNNYTQSKKNKNFKLEISSASTKTVLAKDTAGDATGFKNTVIINVKILISSSISFSSYL